MTLEEKQKKIELKEKRWKEKKRLIERENALRKDKRKTYSERKQKIPTSKKLIWFVFANCSIMQLLVVIIALKSFALAEFIGVMPDFTPLITLVGTIVTEVLSYAIYAIKSAKENTVGGITYDMAMKHEEESSNQEENVG